MNPILHRRTAVPPRLRAGLRLIVLGVLWGGLLARSVQAAEEVDYASLDDDALQEAVGAWAELSVDARRALLTEIHHRMVAAGKQPVLRLRAERRFGYRVEGADGRVLRIERRQQVFGYRSLDPEAGFGVGFERRIESPVTAASAGPVVPEVVWPELPVPAAGLVPVFQPPVSEVRIPERPR